VDRDNDLSLLPLALLRIERDATGRYVDVRPFQVRYVDEAKTRVKASKDNAPPVIAGHFQ
jgi:hypothetical protein